MEQNKLADKELFSLKKELERIFGDYKCLQTGNPSPGANPWITPVTPDVAIAQMKAAHDAWKEQLDKINADRNKDIWDAVKKILMEYIDDPFTCDPRTASREEFARRNINAVVFCELHKWKDLCYTLELMGVVQGNTLITPNGGRIENFGWQQGELKPGMLTYEAFPHPKIRLANIGEMTTNHEKTGFFRESFGFFGPIYDTGNDNG